MVGKQLSRSILVILRLREFSSCTWRKNAQPKRRFPRYFFFGHAASYMKRRHFVAKAFERRAKAEKPCIDCAQYKPVFFRVSRVEITCFCWNIFRGNRTVVDTYYFLLLCRPPPEAAWNHILGLHFGEEEGRRTKTLTADAQYRESEKDILFASKPVQRNWASYI